MNLKHLSKNDYLIFFLAFVYTAVLFVNIDFLRVPHGDIYQYINDAKAYRSWQLPHLIQLQPLFPILMGFLVNIFQKFEFPYFIAAKSINILSAGGLFVLVYLILARHVGKKVATIISVICALHPLSIVLSLDITNIPLYVFLVVISMYLINNRKAFLILATLTFMVRVEGIVLFAIYWFVKRKKSTALTIAIGVMLLLTTIQTIHNYGNNTPYGNYYLYEVAERKFDSQNFVYLFGLIGAIFSPKNFPWWGIDFLNIRIDPVLFLLMSASVLSLIVLVKFKKTQLFGLYLLCMVVVHIIFPAIEYRYYYVFFHPLLVGLSIFFFDQYQKISNKRLKLIVKMMLASLIVPYLFFLLTQFRENFVDYKDNSKDLIYTSYRYISNYLVRDNYCLIANEYYLYSGLFLNSSDYGRMLSLGKASIDDSQEFITINRGDSTLTFLKLYDLKHRCDNARCIVEENIKKDCRTIVVYDPAIKQYANLKNDFWMNMNGSFLLIDLLSKPQCLQDLQVYNNNRSTAVITELDHDCFLY